MCGNLTQIASYSEARPLTLHNQGPNLPTAWPNSPSGAVAAAVETEKNYSRIVQRGTSILSLSSRDASRCMRPLPKAPTK